MRTPSLPVWARVVLLCALSRPIAVAAQPSVSDAGAGTDADAGADAGAGTDADAGADASAGTDADAGVDADAEAPLEAASDATRVVRIRQVIELDQKRLTWLRGELLARKRWFEELASMLEELNTERTDKHAALEALGDKESEKANLLRAELEELQEDFKLVETQTDLALKSEKIIRQQVDALETKLDKERHALGKLTGEIQAEVPEPDETSADEARQPADQPVDTAPPGGRILPAEAPTPTAEPAAPSKMTAAQLEAQKVLEEAERGVEVAKQELSEFVERKQALQQQIDFEEEVAESDAKERENLARALDAMEARLQKYREAKLPRRQIAKREQRNEGIAKIIKEAERAGTERTEYITSLHERLRHLDEAELRVTAQVDEAQAEADEARGRVKWLASPLHPQNIAYWARERGPRILLVVATALLLILLVQFTARRIARAVVRRRRDDRSPSTGRADTLAFSFRSAFRVLIVVLGTLLVLQEAGVDVKTVLGGAAILGVAIAFGAQDLMKDYFSGFLILLEDQYQLGDLVTIGSVTGTVESVNMRITVLRDLEGRVHFIPNGNIDHVTNRTYGWGRPVFEIPVDFDEDVDRVMQVLVDIAKGLRDDPDWKGAIIGEPEMLGVDRFTEYGPIIKFMVKTQPDQLFAVRRQMFRRISKRFNELGIRITVPQRIIVRDGAGGESL